MEPVEIDPVRYGVLWQRVQEMDKKIDKMERQLEQLVAMAIKAFEGGTTVSTEWATYRQALRDVTDQEGFPHDITWPEAP